MPIAGFGWTLLLAGGALALDATAPASAAHAVKSPDGVEIRYEWAGSGEPTIVFVHGWSCDRSYWRAQIDSFSKTNRVVAIDLGGHGESGLGRKEWTMQAFGADVRAVLEALDARGVVLVGHSMGGPVILEAARQAPDRVAALVPVDTLSDVGQSWGAEQKEAFLAPMRADFRKATDGFVRQVMFTPRTEPALIDRIAVDMASAPPEVALSAMSYVLAYDQAAALAAVKAPLRLLNADRWPTNLAAARKHKPDVELAVMPRVGHFLMAEDPAEFNRLLGRAVRELTTR
jgi:pimeloyl-ACP methyl ester carboxylesterase